jgi:AcrR family transcriptional regulator
MARKQAKRQGQRDEAPRSPGRPAGSSGDVTRERVVVAAVETFARQGLAGASVRDIARRARIRVSSLYHYFPSKEALYEEVQERAHAQIREIMLSVVAKDLDLRATAREGIGRLFDFFVANRAYAQLGFRSCLDGDPRSWGDPRIASRWLGFTEGLLKPAQTRGELKGIDPALFMITLDAVVHWHAVNDGVYRRILGTGLDDADVMRRTREHVVQVGLRTLGLD